MKNRLILEAVVVLVCTSSVIAADLAVSAAPVAAAPVQAVPPPGIEIAKGDGHIAAEDVAPLPSAPDPSNDGPQPAGSGSFEHPPGVKPSGWESGAEGFVEGRSKIDGSKTTEIAEVFDNPDGTNTVRVSPEPVRFKDATGAWVEFATGLVAGPGGRLVAEAAPPGDSVASAASPSAPLATVATPAGPVSLLEPGLKPSSATLRDGDAVFADALPGGADLQVGLLPHGFESSIVLAGPDEGRATYREDLQVPVGITARTGGAGIELVDGSGQVVGQYGSGLAWDEASHPAQIGVATRLVGQSATLVTVENSVDQGWLADPARVFPVRIDPSFSASTGATGAVDTWVQSNLTTPQSAAPSLQTGNVYGSSTMRRSLLRFNLAGLVGSNRNVLSANLNLKVTASTTCTATPVVVRSLTAIPDNSTVWSNQPGFGATSITSPPFAKGASSACPAGMQALDVASLVQKWVNGSPNNGLAVVAANETDPLSGKVFDAAEGPTPPTLTVTYDRLPTNGTPSSPSDHALVTSTDVTLAVNAGSDPDGDPLQYWFKVATDPDAQSGSVLSSGWQNTTSWAVPSGALVDGQTYYWSAYTWDGISWPAPMPTPYSFTVDLRLGDSGIWPTDELGPAKVNLTNGNVVVSTSSPSFPTVGGDLGVSYSYNAKAEPTAGLTGSYYLLTYNPPADHMPTPGREPNLVRRDPAMTFDWGTGTPWTSLDSDNFYISWSGYLTVPTTGTYNMGLLCDDGARVTVGGTSRLDKWNGCGAGSSFGAGFSLTQGQSVPITVEYWEGTGTASVDLQIKGPGLDPGGIDVPPSWLSTAVPGLPTGWTTTAAINGSTAWSRADVSTTAITFIDAEGTAHRYTWDPLKQSWQPPAGEYGVARIDGSGNASLIDDDGTTYTFGPDGMVRTVQSPTDDNRRVTATMTWTGTPPKLTAITDPVSGRSINLSYGGSPPCTTASGFSPAPAGMLCSIDYGAFGGGTTFLRYNANGQLARIEDPGSEFTDFSYDAAGRLSRLRDPLAADALAASVRSDGPSFPTETLLSYDTNGKVTGVKLPEPLAGQARPEHTYTYTSGTTTNVSATGLISTTGKLDQVTFDAKGRVTAETDQAGRVTHTAWDDQDRVISTWDDATGLKSTTVYDSFGNTIDNWGPAPVTWWPSASAGGGPNGANQASTPHATAQFDGDIATLAATWWANNTFSGAPSGHSTGINPSTDLIYQTWGTGAPASLGSPAPAQFSGRITGWINIANTNPYDFQISSLNGTAKLYVDNALVIDASSSSSGYFFGTYNPPSPGWKQVSIDFADTAPTAGFGWWWRQGGAAWGRVPTTAMNPGYGLQTSTTDPDRRSTATSYRDPARHIDPYLGIATGTTVDPGTGGHLNRTSTVTLEDPTTGGYLRETAHTLPSGTASTVSTVYYGDTETADVPCPGGDTNVNQGGMVKSVTAADPDGPGGADAVVRDTVYDRAGRPAATRVRGDGAWTCSTFDDRGRVTQVITPGLAGAPGHVEDTNYSVNANPLATAETDTATGGTGRTITTVVDLLGRTRWYWDGWTKLTSTAYDQVGRPS
ncbi:MAG: PA14 domain-containing protein, partial [Acidimicrobiales bacterium]